MNGACFEKPYQCGEELRQRLQFKWSTLETAKAGRELQDACKECVSTPSPVCALPVHVQPTVSDGREDSDSVTQAVQQVACDTS